ncbi:MAG: hypothetical protein U0L85_03475 [Bacilli bacterium]|nr:hypothetical protein [Bacilli bacterium]
MEFYSKKDIESLKKECHPYYVPDELFGSMQYKLVRLEVKWAYVACLNVLINSTLYDNNGHAYMKSDHPALIDVLAKLANKKVDQEKIEGYIRELEDHDLLRVSSKDIYLQKIERVF